MKNSKLCLVLDIRHIISFLACLVIYGGCSPSSQVSSPLPGNLDSLVAKKYSVEELKNDFTFLIKTLEEVHPSIYARTSKEHILKEKERITHSLVKPLSRIEYWNMLAPFVAQFHEGHTSVFYPAQEKKYLYGSRKLFPFNIKFKNNEAIISENFSNDSIMQPGIIINSINR
ncbi:MAG: hypothetical protein HY965_09365, partial [Ignavibacteriales bacterium]|nr:hypothetical protein [Ignavibacteriales bacterium]